VKRFLLALGLAWIASAPALAQDMPLSQILIDGEGWKKVESPVPRVVNAQALTHSPDGSAIFRWTPASGRFVEARQTKANDAQPYVAYCPLRLKRGQKPIAVAGLTADKDGRIYAATEIGVQVFDPTGRMCGVLTPAAPGTPTSMAFEGDKLTLWIGETKYARKLRTEGAK
jgi:sugar lactone lactonase YvrE